MAGTERSGRKRAPRRGANLSKPLTSMYIYVSFRLPVGNRTLPGFAFSARAAAEGLFFFEIQDSLRTELYRFGDFRVFMLVSLFNWRRAVTAAGFALAAALAPTSIFAIQQAGQKVTEA